MSRLPEQRNTILPNWWVRLCQWLWPRLKFFWITVVLGIVLGIVATWLTTKGFNINGTPLEWIPDYLPLFLVGVGMFIILTVMVGYYGQASSLLGRPTLQDRRALIRRVADEYRRQQTQSLQDATIFALNRQDQTEATLVSTSLVSWRMDVPGKPSLATPTSIVQAYDQASAGLLILGDPGVGKSTLLLELALALHKRAEQDTTQPVPVIVNLSSWTYNKLPLRIWLEEQLYSMCRIQRHLSQAWIEQNELLLLLDGLDEMEPSARSTCIKCIDDYRDQAQHVVPLVVCSRRDEYLVQEKRLRMLAIVEVQRLTPEQVEGYLKGVGEPLEVVQAALQSNAILRELVTTPLLLSVVILAYQGKAVEDLPHLGSAEEQQQQVFEHYVTRRLEQQAPRWHFASQQTQNWLIWLAVQMKQRQLAEFYTERLQSTWLTTKVSLNVYKMLNGLAIGLCFGLINGQIIGLVVGLLSGLHNGLVVGSIVALVSWLFGWWAWEQTYQPGRWMDKEIQLHETAIMWSWKFFWCGLVSSILLLGLLFGLTAGLIHGLRFGLIYGIFAGLGGGLVIGLLVGERDIEINEQMRRRPNQGMRASVWIAILKGVTTFLVMGLITGLIVGLITRPITGLIVGLIVWLDYLIMFSLMGGMIDGKNAYIQHYFLRYALWRSGVMPLHYVRFLEEATERILLQRVGGGYRFIHPLFQEYFASLVTPTTSHSVEKPSSRQT